MATKNIDSVESYPENYDFLQESTQETIITLMNKRQKIADMCWEVCKDSIETEYTDLNDFQYIYEKITDKNIQEKLLVYNISFNMISAMKIAYSSLGIKVEYNWPNHKGEWFLATKEDAINYENYEEPEPEVNPLDPASMLLTYGEVGI